MQNRVLFNPVEPRGTDHLLGELSLDRADNPFVLGWHVGGEAGGDAAIAPDQELLEVPMDLGCIGRRAWLLGFARRKLGLGLRLCEMPVERMLFFAGYRNL